MEMESKVPGMGVCSDSGSLLVKAHWKEYPCPHPGRAQGGTRAQQSGITALRSQQMLARTPLERISKKSMLLCFQEAEYSYG